MRSALDSLPQDIDALRSLLSEQVARNAQLEADRQATIHQNQQLQSRVVILQEQLNLALARRFAARSEKLSPDQIRLFDEAEADAALAVEETDDNVVPIASHTRQKRGRKPLPEALPRVDVVHDLPAAERRCPHDGAALAEIGQVVSEQLDIVPAKIQVLRHIRKQYACACGQCIKTAPLPAQPIPKSLASPGLLAHVAVSKYQDALPLYRQETILARIGVELSRATLANWMMEAGTLIQPLINLLREQLIAYDIVQMDETPVQVLHEPGKAARSKSYLWLARGGPPDQRIILFDYDPSRGAAVPARLLDGFKGTLQTDGYAGYHAVVAARGLTRIGCWAHARRKFDEAVKAQGKNPRRGRAHQGLALIRKLYAVEARVRAATPAQRYAARQQDARPVLDTLRTWLDQALPQVPPTTATGKALNYLHNEWPTLIGYVDDGQLEIDNNLAENALRPFVLGRKNWLFSDSVRGVKASANLYSLIETAKANGLEPYAYLRRVFTELPQAQTVEAVEALLPDKAD
ncbi:MAG: IS66 family transposase [Steroidobacteraceae bacterium]